MPIDLPQLLKHNPDLAERAIDAGATAADFVQERLEGAARDLRNNATLLIAGGVILGVAVTGIYLGTRYQRQQRLARMRAERDALALELDRELARQSMDAEPGDTVPAPIDDPTDELAADGSSLAEMETANRLANTPVASDDLPPDMPHSQGVSVLAAEFADRDGELAEDQPLQPPAR